MANPWDAYLSNGYQFGDIMKGLNSGLRDFFHATDWFDLSGQRAANSANAVQWAMQKDQQNFNALEAEKQRQFQLDLSNSAISRQVADLKNAGLNPWLAIQGGIGQGASTPSSAVANSSLGSSDMAQNKLAIAAGVIATALRMFLTKVK